MGIQNFALSTCLYVTSWYTRRCRVNKVKMHVVLYPVVTRCHPLPSIVTRSTLSSPIVTRYHSLSSVIARRHPLLPVVTRCHPL